MVESLSEQFWRFWGSPSEPAMTTALALTAEWLRSAPVAFAKSRGCVKMLESELHSGLGALPTAWVIGVNNEYSLYAGAKLRDNYRCRNQAKKCEVILVGTLVWVNPSNRVFTVLLAEDENPSVSAREFEPLSNQGLFLWKPRTMRAHGERSLSLNSKFSHFRAD